MERMMTQQWGAEYVAQGAASSGPVTLAWGKMNNNNKSVYDTLHLIYQKHRRNHPENGDSQQMCCMWSTDDPPDIVEGTPPFDDIEEAFGISIDDDAALELYDMHLGEAARKIVEIQTKECQQ